jgi:hypothetical protein
MTMVEAADMEVYMIATLDPDYNILPGGQLGPLGVPWSEETRAAIMAARVLNKKPKPQSAIDATIAFHTGRKRSAETCENIGASKRGKHQTPEAVENNRQSQLRRWEKYFQENPDKKGRRTREQSDRENEAARLKRKQIREIQACL